MRLHQNLLYVVLIFLLGLGFAFRLFWQTLEEINLPRNQQISFSANIAKEPKFSGQWQVIEIAGSRIYTDFYPRFRVGDRIKVTGRIDDQGRIFAPQIQIIAGKQGLAGYLSKVRAKASENISKLLPLREAILVNGTVLGVDDIEGKFRDQLIKTGTIHVVVVSGQNLMIVAGIFLSLIKYLGRRKSLILALAAVFVYAALTGFEPPVLRASLMVLFSTLAIYFGREVWPLWSLFLAALVIIFIWPQAVFEVSFQLTFAATLGIMTLGQYLIKVWQKIPLIGQNAAIATSAYIFTAPIILYYFGRISPLAPLANILVAEAIFPVMVLGFAIAILGFIFLPLAQLVAYAVYVPALYFVKVVELFAKIPVDQLQFGRGNLAMVVGLYLLILSLIWIWTSKSKSKSKV